MPVCCQQVLVKWPLSMPPAQSTLAADPLCALACEPQQGYACKNKIQTPFLVDAEAKARLVLFSLKN